MNINSDYLLLENVQEELGEEYEAWLDEIEAVWGGLTPWAEGRTIFIDDFRVRDIDEEDDLVY